MRPLLLLALALTLAACDSSTPDPTPLRSFTVTGVPAPVDVELTDTVRVAVPSFGVPVALTFTSSSSGIEPIEESNRLAVHGMALGDGTVSIRASATGYRDTTVTFDVRVVPGVCPPEPEAGLLDVFPFVDGQAWTFDVSQASGTTSTGVTWANRGLVQGAFQDVRCLRGTRRGKVSYRYVEGSRPAEVLDVHETSDHQISFATPSFAGASNRVTFIRYQPTPTLSVSTGLCVDSRMEFEVGVGLQRDTYLCYGGASGYSGRRFVRQP